MSQKTTMPCMGCFCFAEVEGLNPWTILKVVAREDSEWKLHTDFVWRYNV